MLIVTVKLMWKRNGTCWSRGEAALKSTRVLALGHRSSMGGGGVEGGEAELKTKGCYFSL